MLKEQLVWKLVIISLLAGSCSTKPAQVSMVDTTAKPVGTMKVRKLPMDTVTRLPVAPIQKKMTKMRLD